jgi:T5orf172 domain
MASQRLAPRRRYRLEDLALPEGRRPRGPVLLIYRETQLAAMTPVCLMPLMLAGLDDAPNLCGDGAQGFVAGIPLCHRHLERLMRWREERTEDQRAADVAERHARELALIELEASHRVAVENRRRRMSVVYYVRRQDGLIKIGTSSRLRARLSALRKEHGELELLLTHAGAHDKEHELHRRFAKLRVEGEWFRNTKRLALWIQKCRLDPVIASTQAPGTVDMVAIRLLLRDGIRASLAASAPRRAEIKADYIDPAGLFDQLRQNGHLPLPPLRGLAASA